MARKIDIKKFRHDISTLKKRGLISGVDARSVTPTRKLRNLLDKYDPVLSGKASAVKLSAKGIKEYKDLGKPFEVVKPRGLPQRVVIPHEAGERVTVTHGKVRVANPAGVTRTILPVRFENLQKYLNQLRKQKVKLGPGEQFAFRFFDNRSIRTYPSMNALVNSLEHYETVFDAIEENDAEGMQEIYQNLEIVKVEDKRAWTAGRKHRGSRTGTGHQRSGATAYERRKRTLEDAPQYKQDEYKRQQAERQAAYRARLKGAELTKYKTAAKKRAKKSAKKKRAAKKAKKG